MRSRAAEKPSTTGDAGFNFRRDPLSFRGPDDIQHYPLNNFSYLMKQTYECEPCLRYPAVMFPPILQPGPQTLNFEADWEVRGARPAVMHCGHFRRVHY